MRILKNTDSQVNCLKITKDRVYVAVAGNPNINVFETDSRNKNPALSFQGHTENVTEIGYDITGSWMYSGSEDKTVKLWDMRFRGAQMEFKLESPVNSVLLHPNQVELLCGCLDGTIKVIDLVAGSLTPAIFTPVKRNVRRENNVRKEYKDLVRSLSISPDGETLVSVGILDSAYIWSITNNDSQSLKNIKKLSNTHAEKPVSKCLFSNNGEYLATSSADTKIKIWNTRTWEEIKTLIGHEKWVWDIRFSIDSKYLLSGSSDGTSILWELKEGVCVRRFGGKSYISAVELNDDVPTIEDIIED